MGVAVGVGVVSQQTKNVVLANEPWLLLVLVCSAHTQSLLAFLPLLLASTALRLLGNAFSDALALGFLFSLALGSGSSTCSTCFRQACHVAVPAAGRNGLLDGDQLHGEAQRGAL